MAKPTWIKKGEFIWAEGDPSDVINRPLRDILEQSGLQRDGTDFQGFVTTQQLNILATASGSVSTSISYITNSINNVTASNTFVTNSVVNYTTSSYTSSFTTLQQYITGSAVTIKPTHAQFLSYLPHESESVFNVERGLLNVYTQAQYKIIADRPWETVNPKSFGAKADGGSATIVSNDITNHPEWMDLYAVNDTWDFVGLQETVFAAFGQSGSRQEFVVQSGSTGATFFLPTGSMTANVYTGGSCWIVTGAGKMTGVPIRISANDTQTLTLSASPATASLPGDKIMVIQWNGAGNPFANHPVQIPAGSYGINRTLFMSHVLGGLFQGAGKYSTLIGQTTPRIPVVETNGISYSLTIGIQFHCISPNWANRSWTPNTSYSVGDYMIPGTSGWVWQCTTAGVSGPTMANFGDGNSGVGPVTDGNAVWSNPLRTPLVRWNWDGNGTNWAGALQANTFIACEFNGEGRGVPVGISIAESGDGVMGSENTLLNCHWMWFTLAGFYSNGMNALQNTIIGGNFASCDKHAVFAARGAFYLFSVGFQNGWQSQYNNGGSDLRADNSAGDHSLADGCRSESLIFARFGNDHRVNIRGSYTRGVVNQWQPNTSYSLGAWVTGRDDGPNRDGRIFQCIGAGPTTATEPQWFTYGLYETFTETGGTVQWQQVNFYVIGGSAVVEMSNFGWGQFNGVLAARDVVVSRADWFADIGTNGTVDLMKSYNIQNVQVFTNNDVLANQGNRRANSPRGWSIYPTRSAPVDGGGFTPAYYRYPQETAYSWSELGAGSALFFSNPNGTVGIRRGDFESGWNRNVLGIVGKIGKLTPTNFDGVDGRVLTYPTDSRGEDLVVAGGFSTGMASGGRFIIETAAPKATGSMVNISSAQVGVLSGGGLIVAPGLGADPIYRDISRTTAITPTAIGANSGLSTDYPFFGAVVGDVAYAAYNQILPAGLTLTAQVVGPDSVRVTFYNATTASLTPASGTLRMEVRSRQRIASDTTDIPRLITALGGDALHPLVLDTRVSSSLILTGSTVARLDDARGFGVGPSLSASVVLGYTAPSWDAAKQAIVLSWSTGLTTNGRPFTTENNYHTASIVLVAAIGSGGGFSSQGLQAVGVQNEGGFGIRNSHNGTNSNAWYAAFAEPYGTGSAGGTAAICHDAYQSNEDLRLVIVSKLGSTLTLDIFDTPTVSTTSNIVDGTSGSYAFSLGNTDMVFRAGWLANKIYSTEEKQLIRQWAMSRHGFLAASH